VGLAGGDWGDRRGSSHQRHGAGGTKGKADSTPRSGGCGVWEHPGGVLGLRRGVEAGLEGWLGDGVGGMGGRGGRGFRRPGLGGGEGALQGGGGPPPSQAVQILCGDAQIGRLHVGGTIDFL